MALIDIFSHLSPTLSTLTEERLFVDPLLDLVKVARYSFSGSIPPKFEHKLRRQKQRLGNIASKVVSDEDENFVMMRVTMTSELS